MHITSLPSPHGIGTLGKAAFDFVDFLKAAGQSFWQVLPLGHTGFCDSPYQCCSAFAGNPYLIDLDLLADEGLLTDKEIAASDVGCDLESVDYGGLYASRFGLLRHAFLRGRERDKAELCRFRQENQSWLPDYALFMALKRENGMKPWTMWNDEALRFRRSDALERARERLCGESQFFEYIQLLFFRQWDTLRRYAADRGVHLVGDIPMYVPLDSADVWAAPGDFLLDEKLAPTCVAGVPPDYFSPTGQLWGNPVYDWAKMESEGFPWWSRRFVQAARMFDAVRIDHFRGLESYWTVPTGALTAEGGEWREGPGMKLIDVINDNRGGCAVIVEDLGLLTDKVRALLNRSGFPGMAVLQFAFSPDGGSAYLPHRIGENTVCYTGTHDNPPLRGFWSGLSAVEKGFARAYLGLNEEEGIAEGLIRGGMSSPAGLFIAQMQDWLGLGGEARTNTPGIAEGNWRWRALPGDFSPFLAEKIRKTTAMYGRLAEQEKIN